MERQKFMRMQNIYWIPLSNTANDIEPSSEGNTPSTLRQNYSIMKKSVHYPTLATLVENYLKPLDFEELRYKPSSPVIAPFVWVYV